MTGRQFLMAALAAFTGCLLAGLVLFFAFSVVVLGSVFGFG